MGEFELAVVRITADALHSSNILIESNTRTKNAPKEVEILNRQVSNVARILCSLDGSLRSMKSD